MDEIVESVEAAVPQREAIAPWWHTALVLVMILLVFGIHFHGSISGLHFILQSSSSHAIYIATIEWVMLGVVVAGLYRRREFYYTTLARQAKSWHRELGSGVLIYLLVTAAVTVIVYSLLYGLYYLPIPRFIYDAAYMDYAQGSKVLLVFTPKSAQDLPFWIVASLTAGLCEEMIFRGYLQQQVLAWTGNVWLAVFLPALIFALGHLYQGVVRAVGVMTLAVLFAIFVQRRGNLRSVIVAHALMDAMSGLMLYFRYRH